MPPEVQLQHRPTSWGTIRSTGSPEPHVPGSPEVVVVHGLAVANYLEPAVRELGTWTRADLVELPGSRGFGATARW